MSHHNSHESTTMDCCKNKEKESNNGIVSYLMLAGVGILLVFSVVNWMQLSALQSTGGTLAVSPTTANLSSSTGGGETQAQMMARMHPDQVQASAPSTGGADKRMVGGC